MSTSIRRTAVVAAAAVGLALAVPAGAAAQNVIPGDTLPPAPTLTNLPGVEASVVEVDRETGAVSGTFTNNTGRNLTCTNPHPNPELARGGTVSTAAVIGQSMDYYSRFRPTYPGAVDIDESLPIGGGIAVYGPLWPILQLIPTGSAAAFLAPEVAASAEITELQNHATARGLTGAIGVFTVNDGDTHDWNTTLGRAGYGARDNDRLGALFVCREGDAQSQHYAFAGYEEVDEDEGTGNLPSGSLGGSSDSGSLGSLGSDGDDNGDGDETGGDGGNGDGNGGDGNSEGGDGGNGNGEGGEGGDD